MQVQTSKMKHIKVFLMLFTLSVTLLTILSNPNVTAKPGLPVVSITAPQTVDASETRAFNVTFWLTGSIPNIYSYQLFLTVDDSIVSIGRAWVPNWDDSWIFHGKMVMAPAPAFYDFNNNSAYDAAKLGVSLIVDFEGLPVSGSNLLAIAELQVRSSPKTALLSINNTHTFIEDADLELVSIEIQDKQVNIIGDMPDQPSQITVTVNPAATFTEQNVIISGQITPDKPNVDVIIEQKYEDIIVWHMIAKVKTNETSQYKYECSFSDAGLYKIRSSWIGDDTHLGSVSELFEITISVPFTKVEIRFADESRTYVGNPDDPLPTPFPTTINVTINNATDLYEWKAKIYYDSLFVRIDHISLPADNIFNLTSLTYNATVDLNTDEYGTYLYCEAKINETGSGYTGNGTLFQFYLTGIAITLPVEPTVLRWLATESTIKDSEGKEVTAKLENLEFAVMGTTLTDMKVVNPETGKDEFTFYSEETSVGTVFNATILVTEAKDLRGWRLELEYNATLLSVTKVIQPVQNITYIFHDKISENFTSNDENGTILIQNMLAEMEESSNGNGLLVIIEFKILLAPSNETETLNCYLTIKEPQVFNGLIWQNAGKADGRYLFKYGQQTGENGEDTNGAVPTENYWPYIIGFVVILIVVYLVLRKVKKKSEYIFIEEDEDEED